MAVTAPEFEHFLSSFDLDRAADYAVGVSGGPDSLALVRLLDEWSEGRIHALSVDHGLRVESRVELEGLGAQLGGFHNTAHVILAWQGEKPGTRIQEEARRARYDLMAEYCRDHDIGHLFLGHHADDQAETVLFRLAKGSGLDGLGGMRRLQRYDDRLSLLRPFLSVEKKRLIETCAHYDLDYLSDPSNQNDDYARVRLRGARAVLEEEGLSAKRLVKTAWRLQRAREALDKISAEVFLSAQLELNPSCVVFKLEALKNAPEEIGLRVLIRGIEALRVGADYLPRMEKIEALFADLMAAAPFRKRTLGGLVFERDDTAGQIVLSKE